MVADGTALARALLCSGRPRAREHARLRALDHGHVLARRDLRECRLAAVIAHDSAGRHSHGDRLVVRVDGREVELTQREFDLLEHLLRHAGQVVTRDQLLESVWGFLSPGETRTVEVHVAQLRKKLGTPDLIRTVRGLGYKATAAT